ncbi:hypothetical protein HY501_02010 [Candidatus Woesearchaeota archaeon]|nr:hypothetical protein [Candidatus Woesearchaeota archaeon]
MAGEPPTSQVLEMLKQGKSNIQITQELQRGGYSLQQINEALNQASVKFGVEQMPPEFMNYGADAGEATPTEDMQESQLRATSLEEEIPVPTPPQPEMIQQPQQFMPMQQPMMPQQPSAGSYDEIQSLVEEVIDEKWRDLLASMGDMVTWKTQVADDLEATKQELLRLQHRFDTLSVAVVGKVDDYGKGVRELGIEMKALEKVFEKILEPLTSNIKELEHLTKGLRHKEK